VSRPVARTVWGGDVRPYYDSMRAVGEVPEGGTVVDCPCGAGPAMRALGAGRSVRYVGVDLSPAMLARAERRAARRGLGQVELIRASSDELPLTDASADLFLSLWGLHCFERPDRALAEAARVLKPGGRLVCSTFLRGRETLRQRFLIRPHVGDFGAIGSEAEVRGWLADAGFAEPSLRRSGPMLFIDASAPSGEPPSA
jgi:ubiquinone/menaquinone biosynthesis C-methylase UbiE